ncbi:hypothetical protein SAMN05216252_15520 [Actinacidiphila glaucinigra]|uniref:Uncharacterized protein n=1 Tax=Actinacidiphila glaucinigra TaxID=235986 RepID=A0A239NX21_9ACTN|nr:hypothetical protein SAMN05216252_15520 [Actinacidiphila glaucinigra]
MCRATPISGTARAAAVEFRNSTAEALASSPGTGSTRWARQCLMVEPLAS